MSNQKLTNRHIELIKYWGGLGYTHKKISLLMKCSRGHITKIINSRRWSEIESPTPQRGKQLEDRLLRFGKLHLDE